MLKTIIFVVNGENINVEMDEAEPLWIYRDKVLLESHNTGRPISEWKLRNKYGAIVHNWTTAAELTDEIPRLFLTLKIGAGGCKLVKLH